MVVLAFSKLIPYFTDTRSRKDFTSYCMDVIETLNNLSKNDSKSEEQRKECKDHAARIFDDLFAHLSKEPVKNADLLVKVMAFGTSEQKFRVFKLFDEEQLQHIASSNTWTLTTMLDLILQAKSEEESIGECPASDLYFYFLVTSL